MQKTPQYWHPSTGHGMGNNWTKRPASNENAAWPWLWTSSQLSFEEINQRNFQLKLVCNGAADQVLADVATCNIKGRNVETGLGMFTWPKPVSDWLTQRSVIGPSESGVTQWNSCFYHHFDCCDRCRSRKRFYFCEICLATEVQKGFMKLPVLHGARPPETCSVAPLHASFS